MFYLTINSSFGERLKMDIKIKMLDPTGVTVETQEIDSIIDIFTSPNPIKIPMPGGKTLEVCPEEPMRKNRYVIEIGESVYRVVDSKGTLERIVPKEDETPKNERFINESGLVFNDISSEKNREYAFPNGNRLFIENPLKLHVSKSGGHRLYDADGMCYYIQPAQGWFIKWEVKEGNPNFKL